MRRSGSGVGLSGPTPTVPSQSQSDTQTTPSIQSPAAAVPQIVSDSHSSVVGGSSSVASVHFKVRCERLGHGEDIYLVPIEDSESKYGNEDDDDATSMKLGVAAAAAQVVASEEELLKPLSPTHRHKMIPLYTTAQEYPWYSTLSSLPIPVVKKAPSPLPLGGGGGGGGATSPAGAGATTSTTTTTTTRTLFAKKDQTTLSKDFRYRYAVFRAGVFFRWEEEMDENFISVDEDTTTTTNTSTNKTTAAMAAMDVEDNTVVATDDTTPSKLNYHALPLRFLIAGETYVVNDVLGKRRGQRPDIYHKRPPTLSGGRHTSTQYVGVTGSGACEGTGRAGDIGMGMQTAGSGSQVSLGPTGAAGAVGGRNDSKASFQSEDSNGQPVKRKSVGFAPSPPSHADRPHPHQHQHPHQHEEGPSSKHHKARIGVGGGADKVSLNSTDGLVVVSAFLPVVVNRCETSTTPTWTADWDYEVLLSMQTHLRVTRVGTVRWKGWHGNYVHNGEQDNNKPNNKAAGGEGDGATATATATGTTAASSEEYGVPINERYLVEEALRPFHCVPVWVDPLLFGEMYNGFCKGILWPLLHNVTSVYASHKDDIEDDDEEEKEGDTVRAIAAAGTATTAQKGQEEEAEDEAQQFSELCRDDVEQGPIHGGRGNEKELWSAYNQVNRKFSEVVVQCFNEGDLIWIHGFHLMILPSYLTRRISMAKIGIFLHTPFPSSEIFRTLWCREDLLRGMLNTDQVGFHLFEYARHFLTCCRRLLGLNYGMIPDASGSGGYSLAIETNGRHVAVTSIHAGIEPPVLNQILRHGSVIQEAQTIRQRYPGKTIFCSIDRLESLKGIPLKLLALERFLKRCPEWVGRIVLIQIGITAWERGDDYIKTREEVTTMVQRINGIYPGTVVFEETPDWRMRLQQRVALMKASDVALVTPIRDGLNLIPLEFTVTHQDALTLAGQKDGRRRGLVILSEFASCTRVMRGALHVNPWKISEIAFAFKTALTMSDEERLRRVSCASEFVTRVTTQRWALAVMLDLKGVHKAVTPVQYSGAGLGLGFRLLGMDTGFDPLEFKLVAKAYKISSRRLILFDYGGTITSNENLDNLSRFRMVKSRMHHSEPTPEMIHIIKELCEDTKNTVFVVSGKERHSLLKTLGQIPNLGLAAEHGMYISWPETCNDPSHSHSTYDSSVSSPVGAGGSSSSSPFASTSTASSSHGGGRRTKKHKRKWDTLVPIDDTSWRQIAMSIMEVYESRTHGSYIEKTEMKVLWQYRDADLEFGYLQARELEDHLSNVLRSYPVDILHGGKEEGGFVEVRPKGVHKGVFAMKVIRNYDKFVAPGSNSRVDFALVLGDDFCDEPMLSVMRQIGHRVRGGQSSELPGTIKVVDVSSCDANVSGDLECFTCTIGKKPSAAANYLQDVSEVQELLQALVRVSKNPNASKSMMDLMLESLAADAQIAALPPMSTEPSSSHSTATTTTNTGQQVFGTASLVVGGGQSTIVPGSVDDYFDGFDDEEEDIFF